MCTTIPFSLFFFFFRQNKKYINIKRWYRVCYKRHIPESNITTETKNQVTYWGRPYFDDLSTLDVASESASHPINLSRDETIWNRSSGTWRYDLQEYGMRPQRIGGRVRNQRDNTKGVTLCNQTTWKEEEKFLNAFLMAHGCASFDSLMPIGLKKTNKHSLPLIKRAPLVLLGLISLEWCCPHETL